MNTPLNFSERCAVAATACRDLNPGGHVLATIDGMWSPMMSVAFGDLHFDKVADRPLVFTDAGAAEARAAAWNDRMPEQYRPQLEICSMPVEQWCESYMNTLDPAELFDIETSTPFTPASIDDGHPESARMVAEDAYDDEACV
jgi:hypothetical protein